MLWWEIWVYVSPSDASSQEIFELGLGRARKTRVGSGFELARNDPNLFQKKEGDDEISFWMILSLLLFETKFENLTGLIFGQVGMQEN